MDVSSGAVEVARGRGVRDVILDRTQWLIRRRLEESGSGYYVAVLE